MTQLPTNIGGIPGQTFELPSTGCDDDTCSLTIDSVRTGDDPLVFEFVALYPEIEDCLVTVSWDFGDGSTDEGDFVEHTYATRWATYTVQATATYTCENGGVFECTDEIEVSGRAMDCADLITHIASFGSVDAIFPGATPTGDCTSCEVYAAEVTAPVWVQQQTAINFQNGSSQDGGTSGRYCSDPSVRVWQVVTYQCLVNAVRVAASFTSEQTNDINECGGTGSLNPIWSTIFPVPGGSYPVDLSWIEQTFEIAPANDVEVDCGCSHTGTFVLVGPNT